MQAVKQVSGSYTNKVTVTKAKDLSDIIDIKAGKNHAIALKSNGEVYVTGSNLYGELGMPNTSTKKVKQFTKVENIESIVMVAAGDTHNMALKLDGSVYSWGSNIYGELGINSPSTSVTTPTKIVGSPSDIRYISGGKNHSAIIDANGNVFVTGLNANGELGNNSKSNLNTFTKLDTINDTIYTSCGNTYTVICKKDGTVWATGDYAHGDEQIRSKTKGAVPIQIGNDETGLAENEITVEVGKTKNIAANTSYEFNLIYLNDNFNEELTFSSMKDAIAEVNDTGDVTGVKTGTTRVNAVSNKTGKVYSVLVKVVDKGSITAPIVEAGENFTSVLKADRKHMDLWY